MKTIGLIGGMSWESSIEYYRIINETVREKLGGLHSAKSVMVSVDFAEIEILQHQGRWDEATQAMINAARQVERGGADLVLICTNTMHRMAADVQNNIAIPLLHIADATADRIRAAGLQTIGLLGTRYTMEMDFYRGRLVDRHGLQVLIPPEEQREICKRMAPRGSSSAAPKSACWSKNKIAPCRFSIPPASTPRRPSSTPCQIN
jgi:aspartate racemase